MKIKKVTQEAAPDFDLDQDDYDQIKLCRWCGTAVYGDHCPACGRKASREMSKNRRGEQDLVDGLKRNFGHRLRDWLVDDAHEDVDTSEDVREYTFERESA